MSQPPLPVISANFAQEEATVTAGRSTVRTSALDAILASFDESTRALISNLFLIQRDDGELRDGVVKTHTLSSDTILLMSSAVWNVRGSWLTATDYAKGDFVSQGGSPYLCFIPHTSGVFATDLAAGKFILMPGVPVASAIGFTPTSSITPTNVQAAIEAAGRKLGDTVTIGDFGGSTAASGAVNAAAINAAGAYLRTNFGGGRILVPKGSYDLDANIAILQENVTLEGESTSGYDSNYSTGGTRFSVNGAGYGILLQVRQAALRNCRFTLAALSTTTYGVVASGGRHVIEGVDVIGFPYNVVAGGGVNSNIFRNCTFLAATKVNFAILPQNTAGVGARCYPLIDSVIPAQGNTTCYIENVRCREGKVNWAFLDGLDVLLMHCMSESSTGHGVVIFKRTNTDMLTFFDFYQENDNSVAAAAGDYDQFELFDTTGGILHGDVSGNWNAASDGNAGWWLGSEVESYGTGGLYNYSSGGGPAHVRIINSRLAPDKYVFRMRSARWPVIERSFVQSQSLGTGHMFLNPTANCYGMELNDIDAYALDATVANMKVGGTATTYRTSDARLQSTLAAVVTATPRTMVDAALMSPGNKYSYSVGVNGGSGSNLYAEGTFTYGVGGTGGPFIHKGYTGAQMDVTASGTNVQVTQTSGGNKDLLYKIKCLGRAEFV